MNFDKNWKFDKQIASEAKASLLQLRLVANVKLFFFNYPD